MKILYCNKYNFAFSGTEVYLFELMELMRAQDHEVALFSMEDSRGVPTSYDQYFVPHIDFKNRDQSLMGRAKLAAHAIYSTEARRQLRRMIAAFQPALAHIRNIYHHLSPSILWELKEQGIPALYHLNDFKLLCPAYNLVANGRACQQCCAGKYWHVFSEGCYSGPPSEGLVLAAEAYFHHWLGSYKKCVDHYLVPSRFAKRLLSENGFDCSKITVLPHFQRLPTQPAPMPASDAPVVYFGRLSAEKGVSDLILAIKNLPQLQLKIAGDGPERFNLESLVRELNLTNVKFTGKLAGIELERLIASSRFTVLPSRAYETLGKSILESYAWGRAVVATDLGSRRELVHEGETGLLYESGNVDQLTAALDRLAAQPELAAQMGAAGRRWVEEHHRPEDHYRALTQLYTELMTQKTARSRAKPSPQSRVRVAFIGGRGVFSKYSGIESYYEEAGKRLAEAGYDVRVYCRTYFTPALAAYNGMRVVRLPTIRSKHLETPVHTLLSTFHALINGCDIFHYHALGPALFSFLPRLFGKKTVVTVQGLDWQRKKWGHLASRVLQLGEFASARLPSCTMVVSRELQQYYRIRHDAETIYVPNGTILRERTAPSQILEWGLEPDNYILFLGRLSPEKNCHLLIEAYKMLDTRAKLVFAGGSSHTDVYAADLRKHQSRQILFLDWVSGDALEELLTNAALFVLPSDLEGLSLALLDAMGAGVCVLTSDIPENREVVDGVGFTFASRDVNNLAHRLRLLLSDPEARQAAGRNAQRRVREQYLWPGIATQIARQYQELTGRITTPVEIPGDVGSQEVDCAEQSA